MNRYFARCKEVYVVMLNDNWIRGFDGKILVPNGKNRSFQYNVVGFFIFLAIIVWLISGC